MTLLPTTVVGSYSVPEWLERLKTEFYQRRISAQHLTEIHEVAIKAAVKDQELAGIDIVSDGELRRDNDVDYFLARIPGVHIPQRAKTDKTLFATTVGLAFFGLVMVYSASSVMAMQDFWSGKYFNFVEKKVTREQLFDLSVVKEAKARLEREKPFGP